MSAPRSPPRLPVMLVLLLTKKLMEGALSAAGDVELSSSSQWTRLRAAAAAKATSQGERAFIGGPPSWARRVVNAPNPAGKTRVEEPLGTGDVHLEGCCNPTAPSRRSESISVTS